MIFGIEALTTVRDLTRKLVTILRQITNRVETLEKDAADAAANVVIPSGIPVGATISWDSNISVPIGYLKREGQAISRADHSQLFALIGITFGAGNGSTTFNIPNSQGLVLRHAGTQTVGGNVKDGGLLGEVIEDQMQRITGSVDNAQLTVRGGSRVNAGALSATLTSNANTSTNAFTQNVINGIFFDSNTSPDARTSATTAGETRVSSISTIFIMRVQNLETASATTSAVDSLNSRISTVETKQNAQKLIQIVATQRTFKTTSGAADIVASDAAVGAVNAWIKRLLNYSSQTSNSSDYFEFEASNNRIKIKRAGKYLIETMTQHRRANFGQVMSEYIPPSGITQAHQTTTRTNAAVNTVGSEYTITVRYILDVLSGREDGVIVLFQWSETNSANERYGNWFTRGSNEAPYNYTDTCSLSVTLIED